MRKVVINFKVYCNINYFHFWNKFFEIKFIEDFNVIENKFIIIKHKENYRTN